MAFKKGQSGNPAGRHTGHRVTINKKFLSELARDFQLHGKETIERVRRDDPARYLTIVAALQPKEANVSGTVKHEHEHHHDGNVTLSRTDELIAEVIESGKDIPPPKPVPH